MSYIINKGGLLCIKTNAGYGLFQVIGGRPNDFQPFSLIYRTQIHNLSEESIAEALQGEYYYERINFGLGARTDQFDIYQITANKGKEYGPLDFGIEENDKYFGNSYITYLGEYAVPKDVEIPRFTRELDISYFTGKHSWYIDDGELRDFARKENGKPKIYKQLTPEITSYPLYYATYPRSLVEHFDSDYTPEQYDDAYVDKKMEEFYEKNPNMRPTNEKYDDIKLPLPVKQLRDMVEGEMDEEYSLFCDKLNVAFTSFINGIDENKRSVKKPLSALLKELNKIEAETELIGSLEAEVLYEYIVKILKSLKKTQLIEVLEDEREW